MTEIIGNPAPVVTEIVNDTIFAISDLVSGARPSSWLPPQPRRFLAVSGYVVRQGSHALVIDAGLALNRNAWVSLAKALVAGATSRALMMTRREPDCIINLPVLVKALELQTVYCGGLVSPFDFFERVDNLSLQSHVNALSGRDVTWVAPGEAIMVGDLAVKVLATPLAVLPKNHLFEPTTRTLFGSDSFGFAGQDRTDSLRFLLEDEDALAPDRIAACLKHRFHWMCGAATGSVEDSVRALRDEFGIERICSTFGGVIEGQALVRNVLSRTIEAIRRLSSQPVDDPVTAFLTGFTERRPVPGQRPDRGLAHERPSVSFP